MEKNLKKSECFYFYCEVYEVHVVLYYGSHENCYKSLSKFFRSKNKSVSKKIVPDIKKYLESEDCTSNYFCSDYWIDGSQWIIICIDNSKSIERTYELGCLSHECLHAAIFILRTRDVKDDNNGYEALTYLQEYIFTSCLKKIRQYNKKEKNK